MFTFIYDSLQIATCNKSYREALEGNKFPLLAHVCNSELRLARPLNIDTSIVYLRFPSLVKTNSYMLRTSLQDVLKLTNCIRMELDFHSIEISCLKTVLDNFKRIGRMMQDKSVTIRVRHGCYRSRGMGLHRYWYSLENSGLLDILQTCMCLYSTQMLLLYQAKIVDPDEVLIMLGLQ